ncbi:MAG: hydroxyacylglutathione hydrolase [Gammaproteobacteria bacterium]|nr:hydroxyacylglutathione hydrolase [Gammaproteobacteria bacterium]
MHKIIPIPALNDNYIWLIVHPQQQSAAIVDPGEAGPVIATLEAQALTPVAILITHHHWDHTNGIAELLQHYDIPVYTPANDHVPLSTQGLNEVDTLYIEELAAEFKILDIPGHTHGHIAYVGLGAVFCGDTLFTGGCGRIFEGTASQMLDSLDKLNALPDDTQIYCGHEYTQANLNFAINVEPDNAALRERIKQADQLRAENKPTVPANITTERATNPFLRCNEVNVRQAIQVHYDETFSNRVDFFAALRQWKNNFVN